MNNNNLNEDVVDERNIKRKLLLAENAAILASTLIFSKLIIFNHYRKYNVPVKLFMIYMYTATIDPLVVFAGYCTHKLITKNKNIKPANK
jgi:hypothetical protein